MKTTTTILFIIISTYCQAQIKVSSHIITPDNEPVKFVNIYIKNTSFGVISNIEGKFQINIPKKYDKSILMFSAIGFETLEINVIDFKNIALKTVTLKPSTIILDEIIVNLNKLKANQIVKKAFDNYDKNFPDRPFIAKGFLRHTEKTKKEYKWLIEAALEMYDSGFNKPSENIKINISEIRKSIDFRTLDTIDIYRFYLRKVKKLSFKKAMEKAQRLSNISKIEIQNAIIFHDKRQSNPNFLFKKSINNIRYYNQKDAVFDKNFLKKHTFKIDTIISYDGNDVYKIKITPALPPAKLSKKTGKYLLPVGWIYIRMEDNAIVELDYTLLNSVKGQVFTQLSGSKISSNFNIKFIEIDNKMYPKYISYKTPKLFNRFRSILDNLKEKVTDSDTYYFNQQEIVFTEIITDEQEVFNLLSEKKSWNDDLFTPRPYNAEFWKDYNILIESNEQQRMIEDLEKKIKLKEQFRQSN